MVGIPPEDGLFSALFALRGLPETLANARFPRLLLASNICLCPRYLGRTCFGDRHSVLDVSKIAVACATSGSGGNWLG
jgi:hypothetical protein